MIAHVLKGFLYLTVGLILAIGLFLFGMRFADGPWAIVPGGEFRSGGRYVGPEPDWSFVKDRSEVEFQLLDPPRSRTTWILEHEGRIYIPSGYMNTRWGRWWKQWPIEAEKDGRAVLRVDGVLYDRKLVRIKEGDPLPALLAELGRKYMPGLASLSPEEQEQALEAGLERIADGSLWIFEMAPAGQPANTSDGIETSGDPAVLVGQSWNVIRPDRCSGETLIRSAEPLRSYVIATWRQRSLFILREGGPVFDETVTDHDEKVRAERERQDLTILGVVDLGRFDWNTRVVSGGIGDEVTCGLGDRAEFVLGVVRLADVSSDNFPPERAWRWNVGDERFDPVTDPSLVHCSFEPTGDGTLHDFKADWPAYGPSNHRCKITL